MNDETKRVRAGETPANPETADEPSASLKEYPVLFD